MPSTLSLDVLIVTEGTSAGDLLRQARDLLPDFDVHNNLVFLAQRPFKFILPVHKDP